MLLLLTNLICWAYLLFRINRYLLFLCETNKKSVWNSTPIQVWRTQWERRLRGLGPDYYHSHHGTVASSSDPRLEPDKQLMFCWCHGWLYQVGSMPRHGFGKLFILFSFVSVFNSHGTSQSFILRDTIMFGFTIKVSTFVRTEKTD